MPADQPLRNPERVERMRTQMDTMKWHEDFTAKLAGDFPATRMVGKIFIGMNFHRFSRLAEEATAEL